MSPELDSISTPEAPESAFGGTTQAVLMGATAGSLTELPPAPALPQSPFNPKGEVAAAETADEAAVIDAVADTPAVASGAAADATPIAATTALSPQQKGALTRQHNKEHESERTAAFNLWRQQHQSERSRSQALKLDLAAVLGQRPVRVKQVNTLSKALRSHPIALVDESLQETTHARSPRESLQCAYQAFILGQLKPAERQAYYPICLSSLQGNPVEPTGSRYEPSAWINWARDFAATSGQAADYVACAWDEADLSSFECCAYELDAKPKSNDVKRALMALEQRAQNLTLELLPALSSTCQLLTSLNPRACAPLLHKLQPLFTRDSNSFVEGFAELGCSMADSDYSLVNLLALDADAEPEQAEEFLHQSERPLKGALRKLAKLNDERWAQELAEAECAAQVASESTDEEEGASSSEDLAESDYDYGYDPDIPEDPEEYESSSDDGASSDDDDEPEAEADDEDEAEAATESEATEQPEDAPDDGSSSDAGDESEDEADCAAEAEATTESETSEQPEDAPETTAESEGTAESENKAQPEEATEATTESETSAQSAATAQTEVKAKQRTLTELIATLRPYNHQGLPEAYARMGLKLVIPEQVHQEFGKADIAPLPGFCLNDAETWQDRNLMSVWRVVGEQRYGTRQMGVFSADLTRPVFVNGLNPLCWYGCRRGTIAYTYVYPEAITQCDAQGVPLAQIIGMDELGTTPRVEWFIEETLKREQLSEHFLSPEVVKAEQAFFRDNWLDTNIGAGFAISSAPHDGAYYGYDTPEALARAELSAEDLAVEYEPLSYDQLSLEQIVVASTTPTAAHPYGLVAEVGLTGYVNVLNYLKAKACQYPQASTQFERYQQLIAAVQDKLEVAEIDLQRYANRRLNFEISCDIVNSGYVERKVQRDLSSCDWVANKAQLNFLLEARCAAFDVQRDLKDLQTLCKNQPYYEPRLQLTETWGKAIALIQHQQLRAGKAAFNYQQLLPQDKLPPMLNAGWDALLCRNRKRFVGQHYPSGLNVLMPLPRNYDFMNYDCVTPLYLTRKTQPLAPKPLLIDLQRGIMTNGAHWSEHVAQSYGTRTQGACISLVRPVLTNEVNPKCWYGAFPGRDPGTVIVPEEIRSFGAAGVPNALVVAGSSYDPKVPKPLVAQLLGAKASELSAQLVSAELAAQLRANFERDWRDDNEGAGFKVATDPTLPEFYGFSDALGSLTRADVDHFGLGLTDPQIETYNAQCQRQGAVVPGTGLIYFDRLTLEQIYAAPLEPRPGYYYSPVVHVAFPGVINAVTIITEFMMADPCCGPDRKKQLQAQLDRIETLLQESAPRVAWLADSTLSFQASCTLTNGTMQERQVNPDILQCDWVANRAQRWQLFTARRAALVAKHWYQAMVSCLAKVEVPLPPVAEDSHSCLGLQYEYERHVQLLAGKCSCDYGKLPTLPQQRLIAQMTPEDNERFIQNRYRYEARKLGLPADADERAVLKALQEHAQRYDQELARTLARNRGEDQEQAVLYGSAPTSVESVLKSTLDLGLEMTTDVGNRVLKYVDENLLDVKVKDLSGEVGAKVKDLLDSGSSKVSDLFGRFIKRK